MDRIVVEHRTVPRVLAVVPGLLVAVAVRVLTLAHPPLAARCAAAAGVTLAAWIAYRLLTAHVAVGPDGITVRGVFYDATIDYADVRDVDVKPSGPLTRALVWGVLEPHSLSVSTASRTLRPVASVSVEDDEDVQRVVNAIRARSSVWRVPTQRHDSESDLDVVIG